MPMSDRLTVLITNLWLVNPGGTQVVVRDIALGLLRRGHRPIVYSPMLGKASDALAARGVAVIDDLSQLGEAPDIIHGQHCIPCGEALIRFPETPAIYVCHGFTPWVAEPIHFPQIGAYVAVDEACRDRLVHTEGIDPARVLVIPNAVDFARVPPRSAPLAERPRRAAAFYKAAAAGELRAACEQAGIAFDTVGWPANSRIPNAEQKLVQYDLVFATARAALEALCCGCAVIVADGRGFHGLVTPDNFATLRAMNFGLRSLTQPVTVDRCLEEIARYNRDDAAAVTARAREAADLTGTIEQYERLYEEVIAGARRPVIDEAARKQAEARFLHDYLPRRPGDGRWPWLAERERLHNERGALQQEQQRLQQEQASLQREVSALRQAVAERNAIINSRSRLLKQFWRITTGAK